jgi:ABC-2 type transport system permease protein
MGRKLKVLLQAQIALMLEYRAEIFLWALANALPLILMGVWTQAAEGGSFTLSPQEFARYFLCVFIVRQLSVVWVIWEFEQDVVQGKLSFKLLRPIDPFWEHLMAHLAERITRFPFALALIGLFLLIYPPARFVPQWDQLLLGILTALAAFMLRFLMQYTFALLCFWTERASAVEEGWFILYLFLSGLIAPLDVFPEAVRQMASLTPFPYLVYFPASILAGIPVNLLQGFAVLGAWGLLFLLLNRWLWRRGLRQFSGMGA